MSVNISYVSGQNSTIRSFSGCWTCRVRRKKCDERQPVCDTCAGLLVTCYYGQDKPEWMDGGKKQEEMAERLKREVKEKAHRRLRRGERVIQPLDGNATTEELTAPHSLPKDSAALACDRLKPSPDNCNGVRRCPKASPIPRDASHSSTCSKVPETPAFGRSDTILLMFYIEHLLPFLFPFYRPSLLQGGRAWILEMMMSSPVVRNSILCQSQYFFSLTQGTAHRDEIWDGVFSQTKNAFGVLREALQVMDGSSITEHLHGAVRILASIMQVQRLEITILSFNKCQVHLNGALALFRQLLDSADVTDSASASSRFYSVMSRLGPSSWVLPAQSVQVPSAEQAAFRFSSALLILDDIIASTMLQEQPRLYESHYSLLDNIDGTDTTINLEGVIGCQNWVLIQIGEIAVLDAWKQQCKKAGNLNVMELVHRATAIKDSLESHIQQLKTDPVIIPQDCKSRGLLTLLTVNSSEESKITTNQSTLVTQVWAHAALIYLFIVVSGWQPASIDVRYHVDQIIELLTHQISPQELLRTMVWPFCVAGCLAKPVQEAQFREMVEALQPPSVFGTVRKALEIMENAWRNRGPEDAVNRDLAMCFRSQGDLVLLV